MPYVIGVHVSLAAAVQAMPLDEFVHVNADTNTVTTPFADAALLPVDLVCVCARACVCVCVCVCVCNT